MRNIISYLIFEQIQNKPNTLLGKVLYMMPRLAEDEFTQSISPIIERLVKSKSNEETSELVNQMYLLSKKKFGGFDNLISPYEVLERFVNHYIDPENHEGLIRKRALKRLLNSIKTPTKRSTKVDKKYRISGDDLNNFMKVCFRYLESLGISPSDIRVEYKRILLWAKPILTHFYHLDTIKNLDYFKPDAIFTVEELVEYFRN